MKKIFIPLIGASLITILSAFTCDANLEYYDNSIAADTIVKDTTDTVMIDIIKDKEAEEWSD